jgi:hypothetical protein
VCGKLKLFALIAFAFIAIPAQGENHLRLNQSSLEQRQLQIREFDSDQKTLIHACINILQDIGFKIDNADSQLGLIQGSRVIEDVEEKGLLSFITKISTFISNALGKETLPSNETKVLASIVISPTLSKSKAVRITFIKTKKQETEFDEKSIFQAELYQAFFFKLNKSIFLEVESK